VFSYTAFSRSCHVPRTELIKTWTSFVALLADNDDVCGGNFEAHQALLSVEIRNHIKVRGTHLQHLQCCALDHFTRQDGMGQVLRNGVLVQ